MANPNTDQFDIEDIIREFGSSAPEEETLEELTQEEPAEEPVQAELSLEEEPEEPMEEEYEMDFSLPQEFFEKPEPAIFEDEVDTIRLDDVADLQEPQQTLDDTQALPSLEQLHTEETSGADLDATQRIDLDATQPLSLEETQRIDTEDVKVADLGQTQAIPTPQKQSRFVLHPQSNPIKELKKQDRKSVV